MGGGVVVVVVLVAVVVELVGADVVVVEPSAALDDVVVPAAGGEQQRGGDRDRRSCPGAGSVRTAFAHPPIVAGSGRELVDSDSRWCARRGPGRAGGRR